MRKQYQKLLKTPEWLQYRLDRIAWGGGRCENELCDGPYEFRTLQIHHPKYDWAGGYLLLPWQYPFPAVQVLCYKCHRRATLNDAIRDNNKRVIRRIHKEMAQDQLWLAFAQNQIDTAA